MPTEPRTPAQNKNSNIVSFRAKRAYMLALRNVMAKRGISQAQAGNEMLRLFLDKEKAPIPILTPKEGKLTK